MTCKFYNLFGSLDFPDAVVVYVASTDEWISRPLTPRWIQCPLDYSSILQTPLTGHLPCAPEWHGAFVPPGTRIRLRIDGTLEMCT